MGSILSNVLGLLAAIELLPFSWTPSKVAPQASRSSQHSFTHATWRLARDLRERVFDAVAHAGDGLPATDEVARHTGQHRLELLPCREAAPLLTPLACILACRRYGQE